VEDDRIKGYEMHDSIFSAQFEIVETTKKALLMEVALVVRSRGFVWEMVS
jgi:hypothetical protein